MTARIRPLPGAGPDLETAVGALWRNAASARAALARGDGATADLCLDVIHAIAEHARAPSLRTAAISAGDSLACAILARHGLAPAAAAAHRHRQGKGD